MKVEPLSQVIISKDFEDSIELLNNNIESQILLFTKEKALIEHIKTIKEDNPLALKNIYLVPLKEDSSNFLVSDANEVIAKAYLTSKERIFLVLVANSFSEVVQNRLLKIIEEPPQNKEFILVTSSKAALLPTIRSRLPINSINSKKESLELNLDIDNLSLQSVYNFIQENKSLKPNDAIPILEAIITKAVKSDSFNLDQNAFDTFKKARVALNVGAPADFILTTTLLKLLAKKAKKVNYADIQNSKAK